MTIQTKLKKTLSDLPSRFPKSAELLHHFSKQLTHYEDQIKDLVEDWDLKSREAREKSQAQLDKVLNQIKKTRVDLEKRVTKLVTVEKKRINTNLNDLMSFIKSVSRKEKVAPKKKTVGKKTASRKKKAPGTRASAQSKGLSEAFA